MSIFLPNIKSRRAFTLVEIMIVVAIIALLAAIAIPNFVKSRKEAREAACGSNMRVIDSAIQQYLLKNDMGEADYDPTKISLEMLEEEEYLHKAPTCPAAGKPNPYTIDKDKGVVCPASSPDYHGSYKNGIWTKPTE